MRMITFFLSAALFLSAACLAPDARAGGQGQDAADGSVAALTGGASGLPGPLEKARLAKSDGRYAEAIRLYRLALGDAPPKDREAISVELATVLGWSGDYQGSIETFSGVLEADPFNRAARLGLARSYGWAGEYERSKAEFKALLDEDPGNTEAKIGLARVYSWEGGRKEAAALYREVLAGDPGNGQARLGLSRVLWWDGDLEGALDEAAIVVRDEPGNTGAARLERRLREQRGPELGILWTASSDSDSDELTGYKASGYLNISPLLRIGVDYSRFEASRFSQKAHADIVTFRDSIRVSRDLTLTPRLSFVSTGFDAGGTDYLAGGLSANWGFYRGTNAIFSYSISPLVDTPTLIENDVKLSGSSVAVVHNRRNLTASLRAAYGDYSDGNTSKGLRANIAWKLHSGPDVIAGYIPEYREFSEKTASGYFNPHDIISHDIYFTLSGALYRDAVEYSFTGTAGQQSFDSASESTFAFRAKVTGRLTRNLSAFAGYKWSRSALESATGFRFEEFRAGLDYLF
ncbi:MAG: tetratricopeptide repeat protein [Thermodesulfobacteriota bacterium]